MVLKIGDLLFNTFTKTIEKGLEIISSFITTSFVTGSKVMLQRGLVNPSIFQTEDVKALATEFNTKWSESPVDLGDIGEMFLDVIQGRLAKIQFEAVANMEVTNETPYLKDMFNMMAISTDISLFVSQIGIAIETLTLGQVDTVGTTINEFLDKSGFSQLTQFGYGMILANALTPLVQKEVLYQTRPILFDPITLTDMYYKNQILGEGYLDSMFKQGYTEDKALSLLDISKFFPSAGDFIRFMVREVYRKDIVEKYGYDEDFPIAEIIPKEDLPKWIRDATGDKDLTFADIIQMGRLDPEVLTWYWRSHWELPSPLMGYEMLHRAVINEEELTDLLRIADFAPFWIPKMIDISFSPYTRVDARRMYETGTLSDEEYLRALQDIGYSPDKAEKLLEWTKVRKMGAQKDLTMSMVLDAYESGLKNREWALTSLLDVGYDTIEAELIVSLADYDIAHRNLKDNISMLSAKFVDGIIDEALLITRLNELGLNETQRKLVIRKVTLQKESKIAIPTRSDLGSWLDLKVITEDDYRARMLLKGYQTIDIDHYIKVIVIKQEKSK